MALQHRGRPDLRRVGDGALSRKVAEGNADLAAYAVFARASSTSDGPLPVTPRPLPFRTLASVADITAGDQAQMLRIVRDLTADDPVLTLDEVQPRLDPAPSGRAWVTGYVAPRRPDSGS